MGLLTVLFGVVALLAYDVTADHPGHQWMMPPERPLLLQRQTPQLQRQVPLPQTPQRQTLVSQAPFDKCQVDEDEKIHCGASDITAEHCETINCCFDGYRCYYGKAVTLQCTRDGQFVVVVAREATQPPIDVDLVSLLETNDVSCSPVGITSAFVIFQFPVTACGTTMTEENGNVVYENHMSSSYEVGIGPRGSITRDSHFELLFQCRYSGTAVEALVIDVKNVPAPQPVAAPGLLRVELRLGNGQCRAKGCVEEEAAFSSYYTATDYPITKVLREPLYIEVHILERTDPNLVLTLEHCWATATSNLDSLPQWDLLVDGCPYQDDRYQTEVVSVDGSSGLLYPTHYKRFITKMFTFVAQDSLAPQRDTVFIHCAAAVCYPSSTNSCQQPCHRQRRDVAVKKGPSGQRVMVSSGEVILAAQRTSPAKVGSNDTISNLN